MDTRHSCAAALVVTLLLATTAAAQSINPDISVIGDVRAFTTSDDTDPKEGNIQLDLTGVELALQGYLNPFIRADFYLGYHDDSFEIEEAYATVLRGLPGRLQLKAGKYRLDFGKLNQLHPHAYSFLDTPLPHHELLGEEGLADIAVGANSLIPVGSVAVTISGNLLKGDFAKVHHHEDEAEHDEAVETALGTSERVGVFIPTADYAGLEVGLNALQGTLDDLTDRHVRLLGADLKYRWAPDKYRSLTVQGEWLRSERAVHHHEHGTAAGDVDTVRADGFFAFVDVRFAQRFNAGAIVEQTDLAEEAGVSLQRAAAFAGFQVMEETTMLRVLLRRTDGDELTRPFNEAVLQLVFSLGPHRAHWF